MTEEGKWERYPYLDKYDFTIIKLDKRGLSVKDIVETLKDEKGISKQTIYKKHKRLRDLSIIKNEK
jgi:Fe2+ or Zn2+ uptake regulation protein